MKESSVLAMFVFVMTSLFGSVAIPASLAESVAGKSAPETTVCWRDDKVTPRMVFLCVHGLGLHKGSYAAFGQRMAASGAIVYAIDMRGFGSWLGSGQKGKIDFDACLADVREELERIHQLHPGLPVILLGESWGGAIALRATALYPGEITGLISSCPSGERFGSGSQSLKVALHAVTEGFNKPISIDAMVVDRATKRPEVRTQWLSDPAARLKLSPRELMAFQHFMNQNFSYAAKIEQTPVLLIQGCQDKLVRPAGTWDLFDCLKTPNRDRVFSAHAEHLIFEEGQFNDDDIKYVLTWIKKVVPEQKAGLQTANSQPVPAASAGVSAPLSIAIQSGAAAEVATATAGEQTASARVKVDSGGSSVPITGDSAGGSDHTEAALPLALDYWIELRRKGVVYRCNNKTDFRSGDEIRFHLTPRSNGYVYILLTQGTKGDRSVLFPSPSELDNRVKSGQDCVIPRTARIKFDNQPGIERVTLILARMPLDAQAYLTRHSTAIVFVSSDRTGAKDLVPTRMELTWDDPSPVIVPEELQMRSSAGVQVRQRDSLSALAIDIALEHR